MTFDEIAATEISAEEGWTMTNQAVGALKAGMVEAIEGQADWRSGKAQDYPEDERNLMAAEGLMALREYVIGLPDGAQQLRQFEPYFDPEIGGGSLLGVEASRTLGTFRFGSEEAFDLGLELWCEALASDAEAAEAAEALDSVTALGRTNPFAAWPEPQDDSMTEEPGQMPPR